MDVPACNVCHLPLDEEEHQPRHLGCSHDACTACIKALIHNGSLVCPMCRTVIKADKPDDLHINYGVVEILRLFKGFTISENKVNEYGAAANIKEICMMHKHTADKRCITCNLWICVQCEEFHISDIGCEIQDYNDFLKKAKKEHKEKVEFTLLSVRNNLKSLSSKLSGIDSDEKKLEEEMKKLAEIRKNLLKTVEEGTKALNEVVAASAKVDKASSSKEINECMEISKGWQQFAQAWCKKKANAGLGNSLFMKLKVDKEVYASMDIDGKSSHCKLTIADNIYLHCFRIEGFNINKSLEIFPYDQVQSQLPAVRDLVFLDLAICGEVIGRVTIRIRQDLPGYAKNIPLLFTGEMGHSLLGLRCQNYKFNILCIELMSISNHLKKIERDHNAGWNATQGSILVFWECDNIAYFDIFMKKVHSDSYYEEFGQVETGLDIVKLCRKNKNQNEVTITDCGLVMKEEFINKFY